jgi:two-component system sensor histidine kinase SenX3
MQSTVKERLFWWVAVPVLAAVLVALGALQYRWSNEVSAATRSQMQSNLQGSLLGFRMDLTREMGAVCLELRSAVDDSGHATPAEIVRQFQHWQETAAHPALVTQIYLWRSSTSQPLLRLAASHDRMEPAEWPEDWHVLRQRLDEMPLFTAGPGGPLHFRVSGNLRSRSGRPGRLRSQLAHRPPESFFPWFVDQSIPALVYQVHPRTAAPDLEKAGKPTWIIAPLDASVLEKEIFPELAQRYFHGPEGLDYRVAVVPGGSGPALYASDPRFAESSDFAHDAAMNLFGPPFRHMSSGPAGPLGISEKGAEVFTFLRSQAPIHTLNIEDKRALGFFGLVRFEPLQFAGEDNVWQVVVQHQRGSLEAAVNSLRRRHLLLSFGVLVLLALTMALMVIASQRVRRLAALQMSFVAGVSHELRTPLAVISSAAENIAHGVVADQTQLARYGASILKQARQLTHLVEQVLVFAASQQRAGNYRLRPVNVEEVIDAALESTSSMATAAGINVERRVEPGLPPVAADFVALSQCLQNLITNAIKYGGDGHWLGIRADAQRENGVVREVEITVRDRGIGISSAEIKHIFKPFYRSPSVAGSNVHGTGLGLPLARTVIEAMRGRLTVSSEPGRGSSFTIHLGVASGLPATETAPGAIPGEAAGYYP